MVSRTTEAPTPTAGLMAHAASVTPGFFYTLGISLMRGRDFDWSDDKDHPRVAILSRSLATRLFPSGDALGQRIRFSFVPEFQNLEVVGVVGDARLLDLHHPAPAVIYLPSTQGRWGFLFVRTQRAPETLARAVENEINSLGRDYSLGAKTIDEEVSQALVEERVIATLSGFFAGLALLLASAGLYGLMSHAVTSRTREIGVRMALGAQAETVLWAVLREVLTVAAVGIAFGIPSALAASHLIASILFGVKPADLPNMILVSLLLLAVALLAGYLPARRASRIDPVVALRAE